MAARRRSALITAYQAPAESDPRRMARFANLRQLIVSETSRSALVGGPGDPQVWEAIQQSLRQAVATSRSGTSRLLLADALERMQGLRRHLESQPGPMLSMDLVVVDGTLVTREVPGILGNLQRAAAAERASRRGELGRSALVECPPYLGLLSLLLLAVRLVLRLARRGVVDGLAPSELTVERDTLRAELAGAVERRELVLDYQPLVDLSTGGLVGVEALVRWRHPSLGELPPSAFIPLAEQTGDIAVIGNWVLLTAAAQMQSWQRRYGREDLSLAVNVSARQLELPRFAETVTRVLERSCLRPSSLVLEVNESALLDPQGAAASQLVLLRRSGVRVALDDFGGGQSSLAHLERLPVDVLKIDRSFVSDPSGDGRQLLERIIALGKHLGLDVVPEGIECDEELARVQELGFGEGQGFLLCSPVSTSEIDRWLATATTAEAVEWSRSATSVSRATSG